MTAPTLPDDVREKVRVAILGAMNSSLDSYVARQDSLSIIAGAVFLSLSEAGFVVVPREPSEAMISVIREKYAPHFPPDDPHGFRENWVIEAVEHYRAMIAASEKP